jgi:hypothetical protein
MAQKFYDKINEQKKWWSVEVEYDVAVLVRPQTLFVNLDGGYEEFASKPISFAPVGVNFRGARTFEVEAVSEEEARKKFEDLKDASKWSMDFYAGDEYITEGFEGEVESAEIKVTSVEELPE